MTCMPCSYFSLADTAPSPTEAKWPFIVMMDGAVGNLEAATEGRRAEELGDGSAILKGDFGWP